jgi:hypothetical protein
MLELETETGEELMDKLPVPPPDKDAEIALLKMRVHAAETALYAMETFIREDLLEKFVQPIVKSMHQISQQFPVGDTTAEGAQKIAVDAIRASMPQYKGSTDGEILQLFFRPK